MPLSSHRLRSPVDGRAGLAEASPATVPFYRHLGKEAVKWPGRRRGQGRGGQSQSCAAEALRRSGVATVCRTAHAIQDSEVRSSLTSEFQPPFEIFEPEQPLSPLVFNSPHSGRTYPASFLASSRLTERALRRSEDSFVDLLFSGVVSRGAPLMRALFPRAVLDLNREPYELDPRMFDGRLPSFANTRSMRVAGGLGTIARIVGDSQEIYARRLGVDEGLRRIELLYKPYHRSLRRLIQRTERHFGHAILIDCHSMPSASLAQETSPKPDVVLGDRYGTSCTPLLTDSMELAFRRLGYTVLRNKPYAGGFITENYGSPLAGVHALQIEINRALYMDEVSLEPHAGFDRLAKDVLTVVSSLAAVDFGAPPAYRTAAE